VVRLPHLGLLPRMLPRVLPYHILINGCVHHDLWDVIYILHGSLSLLPLLVQVLIDGIVMSVLVLCAYHVYKIYIL